MVAIAEGTKREEVMKEETMVVEAAAHMGSDLVIAVEEERVED